MRHYLLPRVDASLAAVLSGVRLALLRSLLFLLLCGCATGQAHSQEPLAAIDRGLAPPPASLPRAAAFDAANLNVPGGQWNTSLPANRVELEHNEAIFSPDFDAQSGLAGLSYCLYSVLVEDYDGPASIDFNFGAQPPVGNCYIGLARPAELRWDWQALPAGSEIDYGSFAPYLYPDGVLLIAVALTGTQAQRLYNLQIGPYTDPGNLPLENIQLPAGFSISVYAYPVPSARALCLGPDGTVYVGSRDAGNVYALRDFDLSGRADAVDVIASGFDSPVGLDIRDGDLYFSAISEIYRISDVAQHINVPITPELVYGGYPTETHHGWKFIRFGPDGRLYVPVGAPCNICEPGDPYANITRMNSSLDGFEIIARGIRNTVGFDWHPVTGELWFTDNGRDNWGGGDQELTDNNPPCELNRIPAADPGPHFGYPYFHGMSQLDPDGFGAGKDPADYLEPVQPLGPHVAPLGLRFYTGSLFPAEYSGDVFIAEHGSWNRSEPLGARVMRVRVAADNQSSAGYEVFAAGWQNGDGSRWGRPVDVLVMPDGALLVSDDHAGAVYRIAYGE
jgi:glucose/arabinose dehydrogenase